MKRIVPFLLILCVLFGMTTPVFATDTDTDTVVGISNEETENSLPKPCESDGIAPLSGFEGEDGEFYTRIRLTVTDRNGTSLQDAIYGLYRMDGKLVEYMITDYYGIATSSDVPVDTDYYLLEESAPEGFLPNTERKDILLSEVCAPSRVDIKVVYDPIVGNIGVLKTDEDGKPLAGASFHVYRSSDWELVDDITTSWDGTATTIDLPYGLYELYEYSAPEGFEGGGYYSVMVSEHGETTQIEIINYKARGSLRVYKTGSDGRKIQGAVFSIYKMPDVNVNIINANYGNWIEDITTNSNGYAYSSSLLLGDYYTVEKSVPVPYKLDTTPHFFSLTYAGQTAYLDIVNEVDGKPGKVKITKIDDSKTPLDGVVFGLYRSWDNKKLAELTTEIDGTATSDLLIPGNYYLLEQTGKPGYEMVTGEIPFTIDGKGVTVEKTIVNPKVRIFGKVKVTKTDDVGNPLSGVRFGVYCHLGNLIEEITTGSDGIATSGVLNAGTSYYLAELEGLPGYLTSDRQYPFSIAENNVTVPVNVTNPRITGGVEVIKDDGKGKPLSGVVFGIYQGESKIAEMTTGEDGAATSEILYYGDYELRELSTVEGYELIDTPIPFSILEQDIVIEIPVSNPLILGSVRIVKTGKDDAPLSGAVFGLYNAQGQKISELTTGADGKAEYTGLPKSSYYLKELVAPESYVLADELIPFAITTQGQVVEKSISNKQGFGRIKIIKSSEDNKPLPDVVFDVFHVANNEKVTTLTTGTDGTISMELPLGRYYLKETKTVTGYKLLTGSISFALIAEGETVEQPLQNQKEQTPDPETKHGKLLIIKKADGSGETLKNAVFGLYDSMTDEKITELTTDRYGEATFELPAGDYYLRELEAPSGYKLDSSRISVKIKSGETREIVVKNKAETDTPAEKNGKLLIIKKADGSGEKLQNAVFGLYDSLTDKKITELTTDRYGEATFELPAGDYYLRELEAPSGYKLDSNRLSMKIKSDETREIIITNKLITSDTTPKPTPTPKPDPTSTPKPIPTPTAKGDLLVIKKAAQTGNPLSGAVFGVYGVADDKKITELTTNADGKATLALETGEYYLKELKSPYGYLLENTKIYFTVSADATVVAEITNIRDESIPDADVPEGDITIPQTGEDFPTANYLLAVFLWGIAVLCGIFLYRGRKIKTS